MAQERCDDCWDFAKLTCKLAHQSLAGADVADDATTCYPLEDVLAVPGDEMAVVDDVLLTFSKLDLASAIEQDIF